MGDYSSILYLAFDLGTSGSSPKPIFEDIRRGSSRPAGNYRASLLPQAQDRELVAAKENQGLGSGLE